MKGIIPYQQYKNETCAIACMLMALESLDLILKATKEYEKIF